MLTLSEVLSMPVLTGIPFPGYHRRTSAVLHYLHNTYIHQIVALRCCNCGRNEFVPTSNYSCFSFK